MSTSSKKSTERNPTSSTAYSSIRALYLQVRDLLTDRITAGEWREGQALPNELELSHKLGVSVGTVRKALDEMEVDFLVLRKKGRGTFVTDQASDASVARSSHLYTASGIVKGDTIIVVAASRSPASEDERNWLNTATPTEVFRQTRIRLSAGQPYMYETLSVPGAMFPTLRADSDVPLNLPELAQAHGYRLGLASEQISLNAGNSKSSIALRLEKGAPLLALNREHPHAWPRGH